MKIQWNRVTWYSQTAAVVIFVGVFFLGFWLGQVYNEAKGGGPVKKNEDQQKQFINAATFKCDGGKAVSAAFYSDSVEISLSDGRGLELPQTISASGARYANADESFVFWNKGDTAFIQEQGNETYKNCVVSAETRTNEGI